MIQKFGEFIDEFSPSHEYLTLAFSLSSVSLKQRQQINNLLAHFLAEYLANIFANRAEFTPGTVKQAEFKNTVSFMANELLEIAVNFSEKTSQNSINIRVHFKNNRLILFIANSFPVRAVSQFQTYLKKLTTLVPSELDFSQLETQALSDPYRTSCLGYLILMTDYKVKLGWKFETIQKQPAIVTLTTTASLTV